MRTAKGSLHVLVVPVTRQHKYFDCELWSVYLSTHACVRQGPSESEIRLNSCRVFLSTLGGQLAKFGVPSLPVATPFACSLANSLDCTLVAKTPSDLTNSVGSVFSKS